MTNGPISAASASQIVEAGHDVVDVVVTATAQGRSLTVAARVRVERTGPTVLSWRGRDAGSWAPGDRRVPAGSAAHGAGR